MKPAWKIIEVQAGAQNYRFLLGTLSTQHESPIAGK
jgi:hypothetical protein